jgi:hypothetical protein
MTRCEPQKCFTLLGGLTHVPFILVVASRRTSARGRRQWSALSGGRHRACIELVGGSL